MYCHYKVITDFNLFCMVLVSLSVIYILEDPYFDALCFKFQTKERNELGNAQKVQVEHQNLIVLTKGYRDEERGKTIQHLQDEKKADTS